MLTAEEINDAIKHDRATGQRPAGHYDHDASLNVGPIPACKSTFSLCTETDSNLCEFEFILSSQVDSVSGEEIFTLTES